MSRVSFLPDFLSTDCNARMWCYMRKRVLLTSTWILRGGLVEKREEVEATWEKRGSNGMKKKVNTRRSAMVIMKAPTKLETPPFLISSRFTYVDCILTTRIFLPLEDPELRHICLVRNVLCTDAWTRSDNRSLRGDPKYRFDLITLRQVLYITSDKFICRSVNCNLFW